MYVIKKSFLNECDEFSASCKACNPRIQNRTKCAILDAVDEGLIDRDPTRKAIIKGKTPGKKKPKYLNQYELHQMLDTLELGKEADWDWFILLIAKTGMRFSEALALTPDDFDFAHQIVSVNKTYNYKAGEGFSPNNKAETLESQHVMNYSV